MKGLLDTHVFLGWESDPGKLSATALAFLQDPANTLLLSVVSVWEVLIKSALGKLALTNPLPMVVAQQQVNGVSNTHGFSSTKTSKPSAHPKVSASSTSAIRFPTSNISSTSAAPAGTKYQSAKRAVFADCGLEG